jgi:hypothetical protein
MFRQPTWHKLRLMNEIGFVVFACAALALLFAFHLAERQRTAAIRGLAVRSGLHYLGNALPRSLTLSGTPFDRASKVWNVIDGEPRGVRVIAFDCQVGGGKGSWRRTVIAVESGADLSLLLNPEMTMDSTGKWAILYRPKASVNFRIAGLMPLGELKSYLNSVARDAPKTVNG